MSNQKSGLFFPFLIALGVHVLLAFLLLFGWQQSQATSERRVASIRPQEVISATAVNHDPIAILRKKQQEEARKKAEAQKKKQLEAARKKEEARKQALIKQQKEKEEARKKELARKKAEEARKKEAARQKAEEARKQEEARKKAELARQAELKKQQLLKAEAAKKKEEARKAEEARKKSEAEKKEQARLAEQEKKKEEARKQAEEARKAEQARQAEDARKAAELAAKQAREAAERQAFEDAMAREEAFLQELEDQERQGSMQALIKTYVEQSWSRPLTTRPGMQALLKIRLLPTGEVENVEVVKGSGNAAFDRSAIQAVHKAGPFRELIDLKPHQRTAFREFNLLFKPEDI